PAAPEAVKPALPRPEFVEFLGADGRLGGGEVSLEPQAPSTKTTTQKPNLRETGMFSTSMTNLQSHPLTPRSSPLGDPPPWAGRIRSLTGPGSTTCTRLR